MTTLDGLDVSITPEGCILLTPEGAPDLMLEVIIPGDEYAPCE